MTFATRITQFLFRRRKPLAGLFLLFIALIGLGISKIEFSTSARTFFGAANEDFVDLVEIDSSYTLANSILFMVMPPHGEAFEPKTLEILRQMTEDAWQTPYALRVDSAANHLHSRVDGGDILVEPLLPQEGAISPEIASAFEANALASDTISSRLIASDGAAYGIVVQVVLANSPEGARDEIAHFVKDLRARWQADHTTWQIHLAGGLLANELLSQVALEDILYLVPLALVAVVVLFVLAVGAFAPIAAAIAVLLAATLATYGFAGWMGVVLTAGTAIGPLAVMVLVSTSCAHIILGCIRHAETGRSDDPFRASLQRNLAPVTISHLTTACGFLCLNFAQSPPLADMGNIVAFGLIVGYVAVFALLPLLLFSRYPTRTSRFVPSGALVRQWSQWVLRKSRIWLIVFPAFGVLAVLGILRIDYDDSMLRYFDPRYTLRQDTDVIQDRLTGLESILFSLSAGDAGGVFEPEFLNAVDRFATWLERQPNVVAVSALSKTVKELNQSMNEGADDAKMIGPTRAANAQLIMFYEFSLPPGMDLNTVLNVDRSHTLVTATIRSNHSRDIRRLAINADQWLRSNEPQLASRAAGLSVAFARISEKNNSQMIYGFLAVLALVSLVLTLALRSLKYGIVSFVPNLLPALLAFGFWGWTKGDVNLGSTVVTTMTFGIVVDDTVHFLMHYQRCRRQSMTVDAALQDTFAVVGSAITITTLALLSGFGIMALSGFSINQHIGMLTAVVILFALLADLLFLPALLKTFESRNVCV